MAEKRLRKRKSSLAAKIAAVACASCVLTACIGFGIASAGGDAPHDIDSFGIDATSAKSASLAANVASASTTSAVSSLGARDASTLKTVASRDISQGVQAIAAEEEAKRLAAEKAAREEEEARIAAAERAKAKLSMAAPLLDDVDWSIGKDAFIKQWSGRIDAYLIGSPLQGQGATFAQAAWDNGVDPRWSPAISNTESSKGLHCFKPFNAWGWGSSSWSNWEDAIKAQVAGLASSYGYSLTFANAVKYCPPNAEHWFKSTLDQMRMI